MQRSLVMLNELSDDTKLVRFVNEKGMISSVGRPLLGKLRYSFPLQRLSYFQTCKGIAGDSSEGRTSIDFGVNKGIGQVRTCNDALISCWSVCEDIRNPWGSLSGSSFAMDKEKRPYAIITNVGKVKKRIKKIQEKINKRYCDKYGRLIIGAIYGLVTYFPPKGIPLEDWNKKNDISKGIDITTILNIFHKPIIGREGQRFDREKECRFALILNVRDFRDHKNKILIGNEIANQLTYYPLQENLNSHYIEKIYLCSKTDELCQEITLNELLKQDVNL